jgi:hypothetical protein
MSMHLLGRHGFLELIEKHKLMQLEEALQIEPLSTQSWAWNYRRAPKLGRTYKLTQTVDFYLGTQALALFDQSGN